MLKSCIVLRTEYKG